MRYIEAPVIYEPIPGEVAVFLAGGITGCADWQSRMKDLLTRTDLVVINPRRSTFDLEDLELPRLQTSWEYEHLKKANAVLFWFAAETLCPITLFEYGKWIMQREIPIFVGCHAQYARRDDVEIQTMLERPNLYIYDDLTTMGHAVRNWSAKALAEASEPKQPPATPDKPPVLPGGPGSTSPVTPIESKQRRSPSPTHKAAYAKK